MNIVAPKPFTLLGGKKAVLLLHGFTGNTADVKLLGKYLYKHDYTCHAPLYKGHGMEPKKLIQTGPQDWWKDVISGYNFLKAEGFKEIAVAGVSLGGVFSLKLASEFPVKGVVSMCAPIHEKSIDDLYLRVLNYAKIYMKFKGMDDGQTDSEIRTLKQMPMPSLKDLQKVIMEVRGKLSLITSPTFVIQGCLDDPLYRASAQVIYDNVNAQRKQLQWYKQSGHIITLGKEREKVFEDVWMFLNSLDW